MTKNLNQKSAQSKTTGYSPTDLTNLHKRAVGEFSKAEQSARSAMLVCAEATFAVRSADLIGKGKSSEGGWENLRDYAATFVGRNGTSVAASTVVMWTRVGRAMSLGITPDSEPVVFGQIVQCYADKRVSGVLDTGSKTAIVRAVKGIHDKNGKRVADPSKGKGKGAGKSGSEKDSQDLPATRNNSTTLDAVETLLARITKPSKAERVRLVEVAERIATLYGDAADFSAQLASALAPADAENVA